MVRRWGKVASLSVVLPLAVLLSSCSAGPSSLILGKWERYEIQGTKPLFFYPAGVEFFKDGTASMAGEIGGLSDPPPPLNALNVVGTFKFVDDKHLRIDPSGASAMLLGSFVVEVSVSRDQLILIFPQGETAKYRRVK